MPCPSNPRVFQQLLSAAPVIFVLVEKTTLLAFRLRARFELSFRDPEQPTDVK